MISILFSCDTHRYLKRTIGTELFDRNDHGPVKGLVETHWGGCIEDRRSYAAYAFVLSGAPISWNTRKQRTIALSSTKAKCMALSEAVKEAVYLQNLLNEFKLRELADITILGDNIEALKLAEKPHQSNTISYEIQVLLWI